MIVRKYLDGRVVFRVAWKRMLSLMLVSTLVFILYEKLWMKEIGISTLPASILGIAIAFLIGFRVNSAYERWWEARKIWGGLVNDSRTFARQVLGFLTPSGTGLTTDAGSLRHELVHGQIGFVHALRCTLRRQDPFPVIAPFFSQEEIAILKDRRNVPSAILDLQSQRMRTAYELDLINNFRHIQIDTTIARLCDGMGACERIKNTVFPRQYSRYSTVFTKFYSYMLPFVLVQETGLMVVPFTMIIGFIFFALDTIASGIEDPFENGYNDTPMTAICNTIEIDLRQMLREQELPEPVSAMNGFLM